MSLELLKGKAKKYSFSEEVTDETRKGRQLFVEKFPLEKLKDLSLDQYVQGSDKESFCYWLEFKNIGFGIGGGNASKFGIYKTKNDGNVTYATSYGKNKSFFDDQEAEKYFKKLLDKILTIIEYAKNDEIEKIGEIDIPIWNMVIQKILTMYFPGKFLTIGASDILVKCAKEINLQEVELEKTNLIQINYECMRLLRSNLEFRDWSEVQLGSFIWEFFDGEDRKKKSKNKDVKNYRDEFQKWLANKYGNTSGTVNSYIKAIEILTKILSTELFEVIDKEYLDNLYNELIQEQGNHGSKFYHSAAPSYGKNGFYSASINSYIKFIAAIKNNSPQEQELMNYPLNTILYGPPGTGKTYNSINYAVGMIEGKTLAEIEQEERSLLRKRYDEYVEKGQIVFSTFHQSMSYEDFIEGIKPVLTDEVNESVEEANADVRYEIRSGIFKELVEKSIDTSAILDKASDSLYVDSELFKGMINKISLGNSLSPEDNEIYQYCIKNDCVAIGYGENLDYTGVKSKGDILKIFQEGIEDYRLKPSFNVDAIWRFIIWMEEGQLVFISNGNKKLRAIGVVTGDYYYDPEAPIRYSQFRKVKWLHVDLDIAIKSIYGKQFSQQSIYHINGSEIDQSYFSKEVTLSHGDEKYVMIIDEINRGNVSQIFGELITLIEDDKRSGRKEALKIKLPYSKEDFSVPDNIHILGTMNTADRSVEALDSALRRRFSFVEMASKPGLLSKAVNKGTIDDIDLVQLLKTINLRISKLIDSDHAIGHSYFFNVISKEGLINVFKDKVIPLLEEYFFGDLGKLGMVLGKSFIKESSASINIKMKAFEGYAGNYSDDINDNKVFKIRISDKWDFKDIYSD